MKLENLAECHFSNDPGFPGSAGKVVARDDKNNVRLDYEDGLIKVANKSGVFWIPVHFVTYMKH